MSEAGHGTAGHRHDHRELQRRALWIALVANALFLAAEVVGGFAFNSLALLADAAHMTSDVVGLIIALVAQSLMARPATDRHTYGLERAEVLGALANAVLLIGASIWIVIEAVHRIGEQPEVAGVGLLLVATGGLAVNIVSAVVLARARGDSLNMRGAFIHMVSDAAGSVAAILAGIAVIVWDATWVDAVASILIAVLVVATAWGLLRDTVSVLLEGTPKGLDPGEVIDALEAVDGVEAAHHLHLWNLASDKRALSAHVVVEGESSLHEAQELGDQLKALLADRFAIEHATLELECHPCAVDETHVDHGH